MIALLLLLSLFIAVPVAEALEVVCVVRTPATDPGTQTGDAARAVTPCTGSMASGDIVFLYATFFNATGGTTLTVSADGGQTWTSETQRDAGSVRTRLFYTIWNGSWGANPSVVPNNTAGNSFSVSMLVARGQDTLPLNVAITSGTSTPGVDPFPVSIAEVVTTVANAMPIVFYSQTASQVHDNFAAGWTNTTPVQIRNTSGSDTTQGLVYQIKATAGGTGALTFNADSTGTVGWYKLALAPVATPPSTPSVAAAIFQ